MSEDLKTIRGLLENRAASAWRQDGEVVMRLEELLKVASLLACIDRLTQEKNQLEREVQRLQGHHRGCGLSSAAGPGANEEVGCAFE
jgi:hypothetical protein